MQSVTRSVILSLCIVVAVAASFMPWKCQSITDLGVQPAQTIPIPATQQQAAITTESLAIGIAVAAAILILLTLDLGRSWRRTRTQLVNRCESCGYQLEDRDEYCYMCGTRVGMRPSIPEPQQQTKVQQPRQSTESDLTKEMQNLHNVCRSCGHENPDWITTYCVRCGARLQSD